jgi:hypothetical protein
MATPKRTLWTLFIISFITLPFLLSPLLTQSQNPHKEQKARIIRKVNPLDFPMTDFPGTPARDPKEREKRQDKGKKYNRPETAIDARLITVSDTYHWDANLPSLPVNQSDAVILGKVTAAEAHLSSNKTGIYSEFTIEIHQILKNDPQTPLVVPGFVVAERTGGRVRFPSGQVSLMYVSSLGMPQIGKKYVLFLTHNFPYQVRRNEDYRVLTGYELLDGRAVPLDKSTVVNFDVHRGKDEHTFLAELEAIIWGKESKI